MTRPPAIEALKELDPGQRALLDLSLNRELSDSLIAGLLENVDESGVAGMRTEALAALARAAAIDGPDASGEVERQLRLASDQQWLGAGEANGHSNGTANVHAKANGHANGNGRANGTGYTNGNGHGNGHGSGVVAAAPRVATQPSAPPRRPRAAERTAPAGSSGRIWAVAFAVLALVGAISIIAALVGGDEEPTASNSSAETRETAPSGDAPSGVPAATEPVALEALTPGAVAGAATIAPAADGEGYVLRLEGLPRADGYYRLWAYDSLIESVPVAGLAAGSGSVAFELPADAGDYESLDLSVETGPGDSIHSGTSLFRIPLADID